MAKAESRPHPTNLWTDPDLQRLPSDVRRMLDYLMTGPDVSAAGVTLVEDGVIAARIGFHQLTIDESINILAGKGEVYVDWETREVWPVRWARFHKFEKQIAVAALEKAMREIKSSQLKRLISGKIQLNQRYSHQHQHQHQRQRQHQRQHQQQPQHAHLKAATSEGVGVGVGGQDQDQSQDQNPIPPEGGRGSCPSGALSFIKEEKVATAGNYRSSNAGKPPERGEVAFSDDFLRFWAAYPAGKGNQLEAWAVWQALAADPGAVMKGLQQWLRSESWQREAGRYVPNPAKFLREQRWQSPPSSTMVVSDKERFRKQFEKYQGMTLGQIRALKAKEAAGSLA